MPKAPRKHRPFAPPARRHCPPAEASRQDRQAHRTLATNSAAWRKLRKAVLDASPWCRECAKRGISRPANQVDHVNGDAADNNLSNLQSLCAPCHSRKTVQQDGGFGGGVQLLPGWLPRPACRFVVVCGPPAAGKTTYVAQNAKAGDMVIDTDEMALRLYQRPLYELSPKEWTALFRARNKTLAALERAHPRTTAWLIATAGSFKQRKFWGDMGAEIVAIHPGILECINRINADLSRPDAIKRSLIKAVERWV